MWITALVMGFAGSLHCLFMCSPLAMAVTNLRKPYFTNRIVYNTGRIFTYAVIGAFVSAFGSLFNLTGLQNMFTILLGSVLIVSGILGARYFKIPLMDKALGKLSVLIKSRFSRMLQKKTIPSIGIMGMLNGLLPCGLTYLALTYCLTLEPISGIAFMLIFGAGTLPVMLGLTSGLQPLINRLRLSSRSFTTLGMIVLGMLLIGRVTITQEHQQLQQDGIVICR